MSEQIESPSQKPVDATHILAIPDSSPSLSVLREMTVDRERFEIEHKPMACPPLPAAPEKVRAGKRAHRIATLRDLKRYVRHAVGGDANVDEEETLDDRLQNVTAFYSSDGVTVVLDDRSEHERETITCTLEKHTEFREWLGFLMHPEPWQHATFVDFLRLHTTAINRVYAGSADVLIAELSSLSGELTVDSDEFLERQAKGMAFTVKQRRGAKELDKEVDDVPTEFTIELPILADDSEGEDLYEFVRFTVKIRMTRCPKSGGIAFDPNVENFLQIVNQHIDKRLERFADDAGFLCVRGEFEEEDWREPELPESVAALMEQQTKMIAAIANAKK